MSDHTPDSMPYLNRDISWMFFNHRILQEAQRPEVPVLEKLAFLGIYSNNLDEFFRVRMATISRVAEMKGKSVRKEAENARRLFTDISRIENDMSLEYAKTVKDVEKELYEAGIAIMAPEDLDDIQRHHLRCVFRSSISGFVSPIWLRHLREFSRASDDRIWLAVELHGPEKKTDYAVIELPTDRCGRFIDLPDREGMKCLMYLDDVIRFSLPMIFPGMGYTDFAAYSFKFTKDAEMEIDNDLRFGTLQKISKAVRSRKDGAALRMIYDREMPDGLLSSLVRKLKLDRLDTPRPSGRYHNHKDFMAFPDMGRTDLKYETWRPVVAPELKSNGSLMQLITAHDRYIHVPYQSFDYLIRLLQEAAVSKNVKSIRITLYRVARDSKVIQALMCAARNGKKVTAVVELLARFDESSNISWSKKMQDAGINVVFGLDGLKIHSKIIHIGLRHGQDIAVIGTGNFHEGNAKIYTDYFLMTARHEITRDVEEVFNFIKHPYMPPEFRHLLVSPNGMRSRFISLIDDEIRNARAGKEAYIRIKINHITDHQMVSRLYEAAHAGVKVCLLVRGNCSLYTGIDGNGGNLHAAGIIDRYLEHSRIFIFCAGGAENVFIGSADWMPRNLDNRIEVVTPVYDPVIKEDLVRTVNFGLLDNCKARVVDGTGRNRIVVNGYPGTFRSQERLYRHYLDSQDTTDKKNT